MSAKGSPKQSQQLSMTAGLSYARDKAAHRVWQDLEGFTGAIALTNTNVATLKSRAHTVTLMEEYRTTESRPR
jgi:hypothetical protein